MERFPAKALERGQVDESSSTAALSVLTYTSDLSQLSDRDLVIEAVVDGLPVVQIGDY